MSIHNNLNLIEFHKLPIGLKFIYRTRQQRIVLSYTNSYYIAIKDGNGVYNATCIEHNNSAYNYENPLTFNFDSLIEPIEKISWITV
jgi:hypothetical protein